MVDVEIGLRLSASALRASRVLVVLSVVEVIGVAACLSAAAAPLLGDLPRKRFGKGCRPEAYGLAAPPPTPRTL